MTGLVCDSSKLARTGKILLREVKFWPWSICTGNSELKSINLPPSSDAYKLALAFPQRRDQNSRKAGQSEARYSTELDGVRKDCIAAFDDCVTPAGPTAYPSGHPDRPTPPHCVRCYPRPFWRIRVFRGRSPRANVFDGYHMRR